MKEDDGDGREDCRYAGGNEYKGLSVVSAVSTAGIKKTHGVFARSESPKIQARSARLQPAAAENTPLDTDAHVI